MGQSKEYKTDVCLSVCVSVSVCVCVCVCVLNTYGEYSDTDDRYWRMQSAVSLEQ